MIRLRSLSTAMTLAAFAVLAACGEGPVPTGPAADGPALDNAPEHAQNGNNRAQLWVFEHGQSHNSALTETDSIGPEGGTIEARDVRLHIPAGALDSTVEITVTSPQGRYVQAHFEPHGLEFNEPATLSFDASDMHLPGNATAMDVAQGAAGDVLDGMQGVYFEGTLGDDAEALEFYETQADGDWVSFEITHFSRYCIATN